MEFAEPEPVVGESFETAAPVSRESPLRRLARDMADERNLPPVDEVVGEIPEETRVALKELLRTEFTRVRRIDTDRLF
ncbi:MAG: hypothetical protein D6781_12970 [Verrucomicrobia bacterium]|nr:MAG: hypothetical protein D6781_12970 [Verrucomicrobiota bacterium]